MRATTGFFILAWHAPFSLTQQKGAAGMMAQNGAMPTSENRPVRRHQQFLHSPKMALGPQWEKPGEL
jgi:hypothetical protein